MRDTRCRKKKEKKKGLPFVLVCCLESTVCFANGAQSQVPGPTAATYTEDRHWLRALSSLYGDSVSWVVLKLSAQTIQADVCRKPNKHLVRVCSKLRTFCTMYRQCDGGSKEEKPYLVSFVVAILAGIYLLSPLLFHVPLEIYRT